MFGPVIDGKHVRLEPPKIADAPAYQRWFSDADVTRYLLRRHPLTLPREEEALEKAAEDPQRVLWSIFVKSPAGAARLVGAALLERIDWRNGDAKTATIIGEKGEWGKGYAGEAMRLRTEYAFVELGLRRLWSGVEMPNESSQRALVKVGYRPCGVRRKHVFVDGQWLDVWMGELHRDDWERARGDTCSAP